MDFYFSGVRGRKERGLLQRAGVERVLVDQFHTDVLDGWPVEASLDSGAYRLFKAQQKGDETQVSRLTPLMQPAAYAQVALSRTWSWVSSLDVIGDAEATYRNWQALLQYDIPKLVPVWHWGTEKRYLAAYLDAAPVVGIGGLVPLLREHRRRRVPNKVERDRLNAARYEVLDKLVALCGLYPQRTHIFGISWPTAVETLWGLAHSGDSSCWLDGRSHGEVWYTDTRTGYLCRRSARLLPDTRELTPDERCVASAGALATYQPVRYECPQGCSIAGHRIPRRKPEQKCPQCGAQLRKWILPKNGGRQ